MSTNCVRCVRNERTSLTDLLCDECREQERQERLAAAEAFTKLGTGDVSSQAGKARNFRDFLNRVMGEF